MNVQAGYSEVAEHAELLNMNWTQPLQVAAPPVQAGGFRKKFELS
jgi:hypothetical protein